MNRRDLEKLFEDNLPTIRRIISAVCRRNQLSGDDADDFESWTYLKLIENDYATLQKFRGESTLSTYLTVVVSMLYREYRVQLWGRWRPSAAAKRGGPVAVHLETLMMRDGLSLSQAGQVMRTSGLTQLSDKDLAKIAATFPERTELRPVKNIEPPADVAGPELADDLTMRRERAGKSERLRAALKRALSKLSDEDGLIVRLYFFEKMSIANIARSLGLEQKPLYRRLERALKTLRKEIGDEGFGDDDLGDFDPEPPDSPEDNL